MAMNMAWCDITLVAGAGSGDWKHPEQVSLGQSAAKSVALDGVPEKLDAVRTTAGAAPGNLTVTATALAATIASSNGADTGVIRVWGWFKVPAQIYG